MRAVIPAFALTMAVLPASAAWSNPPDCTVDLGQREHGEAAVTALADELPEAAQASGLTSKRLRRTLREDHTLWVDGCGRAFFAEPQTLAQADDPAAATEADAFGLHSRPAASRVLYLDFTGAVVTGTAWNDTYTGGNDFTAEPYSKDNDPAFSQSELDTIGEVWRRVAEDYAPFDVDVTTEEPDPADITRTGASDTAYGTRVLISPTSNVYTSCSCGGIAYLGVFDTQTNHSYYQPAMVFTRGVGTGSKGIAEAASHEAGHNLGLSHDGAGKTTYYSGQGAWAPIMGVGYYRPLTQWSKGDYTNATNTQDDLAVMSSNGATPMTDDAADNPAAASRIEPGTLDGLVSSPSDTDWFRFTATGPTTLTAEPSELSPDLDVVIAVYDEDGALVASSDPAVTQVSSDIAAGLSAALQLVLAPGEYTVMIEGTGNGSPLATGYSDYGSLGPYRLTLGTTTPLLINRPAAPAADVGQPYSYQLTGSGGATPYTWRVAGGSLPPGLTLSADGTLSGTPTTSGNFSATIEMRDAQATTTSAQLTLTVQPLPPVTPAPTNTAVTVAPQAPRIITRRLPVAHEGVRYRARLQVSAAGRWTRVSGALPKGVRLTTGGILRGKPRTTGRYGFVADVQVGGLHSERSLVLRVRR
ncbi:MAG: putative Ig domain-containing protein [Candidatus Nanopelagicales bacterium]